MKSPILRRAPKSGLALTRRIRLDVGAPSDESDSFHSYQKIPTVILQYFDGKHVHFDELNHAGKLLRLLEAIGENGWQVLNAYTRTGVMTRSSVRALNCYLFHVGIRRFRARGQYLGQHKFAWFELVEMLNIEFAQVIAA